MTTIAETENEGDSVGFDFNWHWEHSKAMVADALDALTDFTCVAGDGGKKASDAAVQALDCLYEANDRLNDAHAAKLRGTITNIDEARKARERR
jgi:hypothetical protein